jgi:hypothetical protein
MKLSLLLTILIITSPAFGQAKQEKIKLHTKAEATKQEIAKQIPTGSSIIEAKRILETNGFYCHLSERRGPLSEFRSVIRKNNIEGEFLYCRKEKFLWTLRRPWEALIYKRLWEVAVVHKKGVVSDVFVSIWRHTDL